MYLLDNFAIKNWYRFLLYLGAVILILSLFLEPKGVEISSLRSFSFYTVVVGLVVWIIDDIFYKLGDYLEYLYENGKLYESQYEE